MRIYGVKFPQSAADDIVRYCLSLIEQKGHMGCHCGHQIGDTFDFDTERGNLCPMAMHVAFPYIDILRYGGKLPG